MCPEKGRHCKHNKVTTKLFISQIPYYLVVSLSFPQSDKEKENSRENSGLDTLNTMLLLPRRFWLSSLFEYNKR